VIDASLDSNWRQRLFAAPLYEMFVVDSRDTEGLPISVSRGIRRYRLSYTVCRVLQSDTGFTESDWEGYVFFRFQARKYADIVSFTVNNPDVV